MIDDDDDDARRYPDETPPYIPLVLLPPFAAYVDSRKDNGELVAGRVLGIRQNAAFPDEFQFIVVTSEDDQIYCEAYRCIQGDLPPLAV